MYAKNERIAAFPWGNEMRILVASNASAHLNIAKLVFPASEHAIEFIPENTSIVDAVRRFDYDILIFFDYPGNSKDCLLGFIQAVRRAGITNGIMVISSSPSVEFSILAFNAGADDYIPQSMDRREVLARAKRISLRSQGIAPHIIKANELEIDLSSKQVSFSGKNIVFTGKEFAILEILATRKGKLVRKETFLDQLYNGNSEPDPKIIDVFVCKIRKKLVESGCENDIIKTMWGRGYIFCENCSQSS